MGLIDTLEFSSAYTPLVKVDLNEPSNPKTQAFLESAKPRIRLAGMLGEVNVNMGQVSWKLSWLSQLLIVALLGFALLYLA